jgi:hypothetical protein
LCSGFLEKFALNSVVLALRGHFLGHSRRAVFLCTYAVGGTNFPSKTLSFDEGLPRHLDDDGQDDVSILEQLDFTGDRVGDGVSL